MHIFSTFDHSTYLELALAALESNGIRRENILAVPVDRREPKRRLVDTIHSSDGISMLDSGMALATAFAVLGASYGFILKWGPIICGLIAALFGLGSGILFSLLHYRRKHAGEKRTGNKGTEVIVIVHCEPGQTEMVEKTLWDNLAYGVGKLMN
ncbi:MAG TPA: hypothetical protein VFK33_00455 [Bacillales bacterium]|nr:hypothetical protein [Bacillales bacterium]